MFDFISNNVKILLSICFVLYGGTVFAQDSTQIDWQEFYPLHIGDFWKYRIEYVDMGMTFFRTTSVIGDTVMPNGLRYANRGGDYQRVDSLGNVYRYERFDPDTIGKDVLFLKLDVAVGDTFPTGYGEGYWRVENKYQSVWPGWGDTVRTEIEYRLYSGVLWGNTITVVEGLGVFSQSGEFTSVSLVGAIINRQAYGDVSVAVEEQRKPVSISRIPIIHQNFPNPFNSFTRIRYELPKGGDVMLKVYNIEGEIVKTLVTQNQKGGEYEVLWDGRNEKGEEVASGIYFCRLQVGDQIQVRKILLTK